ncbi:MAG: NADH:flavin oxidoreductase/NADH oxidase, partial [Pseudomonadota bacterium]
DAARGEPPWVTVGPTTLPVGEGWPAPHALSTEEIPGVIDAFVEATRRALAAGYEIVELHGAHGYLIQSFLSPIANQRNDAYGGDRAGRMRFALEVTEAVRAVWPQDKPLFFRVSAVDGVPGGWELEDTVALTRELKALGVDVIDCSSGGITGQVAAANVKRKAGFQVDYAETVRRETGIMTQAVGLITHPRQAEQILTSGQADLIAIGREVLMDPSWPHHAAAVLNADPEMKKWPERYGWWLARRAATSEFYEEDAA